MAPRLKTIERWPYAVEIWWTGHIYVLLLVAHGARRTIDVATYRPVEDESTVIRMPPEIGPESDVVKLANGMLDQAQSRLSDLKPGQNRRRGG